MKDEGEGFLARLTPATRILQSMTGRGSVKEENVVEAEKIVEETKLNEDSLIFLKEHIGELTKILDAINAKEDEPAQLLEELIGSSARFQANFSMTGGGNLTQITIELLRWLESLDTDMEAIDADIIDIAQNYLKALQTHEKVTFNDEHIAFICDEMRAACERYLQKYPNTKITALIDNTKEFYVTEKYMEFEIDGAIKIDNSRKSDEAKEEE